MKALLPSDLHLSDRPPSSCTDSYTDDLFALLDEAASFAVHCQAVIIAGDVFHSKAPSRNSHRLVQRLIRWVQSLPCPCYIVPGNHDVQHDRMDSLHTTQPLGVVLQAGARLLDGWGDGPFYGVPWQQRWDDETVSAALAGYRGTTRDLAENYAAMPSPPNRLVVAHAPLYPPGQELPYEHYPVVKWARAMGYGQCFYGHVHEPHGVYQVGGVTFCNNGALSRGSLHEYNLERQVGCTVWDSETGAFDFVPLSARPASEVFRLREHTQAATMQGRLDEFLAGIAETRLGVVNVESVLASVKGQPGVGPAEVALVEELLAEGAGGG